MAEADKPPRRSEDGSLVVKHPFHKIPGKQCNFAYDIDREKAEKFLNEVEDEEPAAVLEKHLETLESTSADRKDKRNGEKAANDSLT